MEPPNRPSGRYRQWYLPFRQDSITLRTAYESLLSIGERAEVIPLVVRLVENPRYRMRILTLFHGAVDLQQHDYIHLLLGRGLLRKDEAFVIGFTMGSTNRVSTLEETLFGWVAKRLYPNIYRLDDEDLNVFRDAVHLGFVSRCQPLDTVDFQPYLDMPLREVRRALGLEPELVLAYYALERQRYPHAPESLRLLDAEVATSH